MTGYIEWRSGQVDDQVLGQDEYEIAYLSKKTGKMAIDVRRAMMKVGPDRDKVEAALKRADY